MFNESSSIMETVVVGAAVGISVGAVTVGGVVKEVVGMMVVLVGFRALKSSLFMVLFSISSKWKSE